MDIDPIHFDNTEVAFSYKNNRELRKANFIFSLVNNPIVSSVATRLAKISFALHLPVKALIRSTVFEHFCGGETVEQSEGTIQKLFHHKVGTILDYSAEGEEDEAAFDRTMEEVLHTIEKGKNNPAVPFSVFKVTGIGAFDLLEKVHSKEALNLEESLAWSRVRERLEKICQRAFDYQVPVLVDAEDSWIQDPIDDLATEMMRKFNGQRAIVFNTYQMYRADMFGNLKKAYQDATTHNCFLGVKMVRGAYMEKERARAAKMNYPSPIHPDKEATDNAFNQGLAFCLDNKERISLVCGSHNEYSNQYLTILMQKHGLQKNDPRIYFAQLLGMSDNISFVLAKEGYNVAKYVPYGAVELVMPYLLRRAAENTSVAGQSSRELTFIRKELQRRAKAK